MPSASRTIVVDRPIDEVFTFFTTPSNDPTWRPLVKEITSHAPPTVGSTIHQVIRGPRGRGVPADIRITAYDPPNRYAFTVIAGPVRPEGEIRLVAAGATTEVTLSLSARLTGLKKVLLARPVQTSMNSEVAGLDTAKRVIEGR